MKKLTIIISLIFLSFTSIQDPYCDGWEEGYCEGWQSIKGQLAMCPMTPICPITEVLEHEYNDGYNRGFLKGRVDAKR